jgi:hypothetical protein
MPTFAEGVADVFDHVSFDVKVNVASGYRMATMIVRQSTEFMGARALLAADETAPQTIINKLKAIARLDFDRQFEHPKDTVIFALLLLLKDLEGDEGPNFLSAVHLMNDHLIKPYEMNFWWARHLVDSIVGERG